MLEMLERSEVPFGPINIQPFIDFLCHEGGTTVQGDGYRYVGPTGECKSQDVAFLMRRGNHVTPENAPAMFERIVPDRKLGRNDNP